MGSLVPFLLAPRLGLVSLGAECRDELAKLSLVGVGIAQELVFEQLVGTPSLLWILDQTLVDEVLEDRGPTFLERRRAALDDIHNDAMLGFTDIRRVTVCELHGEDSVAPNVDLGVVASFTLDQLGCHPADSADFTRPCISLCRQLG